MIPFGDFIFLLFVEQSTKVSKKRVPKWGPKGHQCAIVWHFAHFPPGPPLGPAGADGGDEAARAGPGRGWGQTRAPGSGLQPYRVGAEYDFFEIVI